jgi:hypothetical protein
VTGTGKDIAAVAGWSLFWVLVIAGAVALYAEWHVIERMLP